MRFHLLSVSISMTAVLLFAAGAAAFARHRAGMLVGPLEDTVRIAQNGTNGWGTFDQLVDHANPGLGTFKQRFWYGTEYWKGPGSPLFLVNPGEQSADRFNVTYTSQMRLSGRMAREVGGAVIIIEHRYWGDSSPFAELTEANLQYLTLANALEDMVYFAQNFDPPFDTSGGSGPKSAPWIFIGGSYSGALAGWLAALKPGTFWAYHGTSGVVEAVGDFWQYFVPVQEATPKNCSRDLSAVIDYIDYVLEHGSTAQKAKLKSKFLLEELEDADFTAAIESGPWQFQATQFYTHNTTGYVPYFRFCDYIENVWPNSTNPVPGPEGVGSCKALKGYAKWFIEESLPDSCESYGYDEFKGTNNIQCFKALNASNPIYKDLTVRNPGNRQWNCCLAQLLTDPGMSGLLCNEPFEWWQNGAPPGHPSLVSRLVDVDYWRLQCAYWFPEKTYDIATDGASAATVNQRTGGWAVTNTTRLMQANGEWDPWRDATVSSVFRPGGPQPGTPDNPVHVIPHGTHCSDLYLQNWDANAGLRAIVEEEVAQIQTWVGEFRAQKATRMLR